MSCWQQICSQETAMADKIKPDTYSVPGCHVLLQRLNACKRQLTNQCRRGFTLVELLVVIAVLGVLTSMALPFFQGYIATVKNGACSADIRTIDKAITAYVIERNALPASLNDVGMGGKHDPWHRPYVFVNLSLGGVPLQDNVVADDLNTDYDLYSRGADGISDPLSGTPGNEDDVVRANDGVYVGVRP